jgi:2-polyprenyl-3-methyl-5-hydroxy-6-metoxy-1,4-benzoquinol methylase
MLADAGWTVYGCELDPAKAALASCFGKIDAGDVRSWAPPEPVDLIFCVELLEHLPSEDQQPLLRDMRRWLHPGGHLVLSTPQRHSPVALVERAYARLRHRGPYDWWDPTHVSVLRRSRLEALFSGAGFVVRRRLGIHLVPELVPVPALHRTAHEGVLGALGFDLIYVLA